MKKLLLSICLFITSLCALEAAKLSPKDIGLSSDSEILMFCDELHLYGFSESFCEEIDSEFHYKIEQFTGYMLAVPELQDLAEIFGSAYRKGVTYGTNSLNLYKKLLHNETTEIQKDNYRRQMADLRKNTVTLSTVFLKKIQYLSIFSNSKKDKNFLLYNARAHKKS